MADSIMLSEKIIEGDDFLSLPLSTQALYFHLCVLAQKKGVIYGLYSIARYIGASESDADLLLTMGYVEPNYEYGDQYGYVIANWYEVIGSGEKAKKRLTYQYRKWRDAVLDRDNHKCVICGSIENLEVHHIKMFSQFPEERLNIDNGVTLCRRCHMRVHKEKDSEWLYLGEQKDIRKQDME